MLARPHKVQLSETCRWHTVPSAHVCHVAWLLFFHCCMNQGIMLWMAAFGTWIMSLVGWFRFSGLAVRSSRFGCLCYFDVSPSHNLMKASMFLRNNSFFKLCMHVFVAQRGLPWDKWCGRRSSSRGELKFQSCFSIFDLAIRRMGKAFRVLELHPPEPHGHWGCPLSPVIAKALRYSGMSYSG